MKRDFLKELGLEDDAINKIMSEHGKSLNEYKDKADKVDTLESQIADYQTQIADRDKQLKDLSKKAEGNEDLQQTIKDLQKANDDVKKEYDKKLADQKRESKIEIALKDAKAKNVKAVKANLDLDVIKLDGDKLIGLEEQLKNLQESDGYLFDSEQPSLKGRQPQVPKGGDPKGMTKEQFKEMGYADRVKLYNDNPELYKQLSN